MKQALRRNGFREIGGILMGHEISYGNFIIVDFSLDEFSGERAHFVRNADHHRHALKKFFERTGHNYSAFNYLGEWHSHPGFPVRASNVDLLSMRDLVEGERDIEFAVLLIVKLGSLGRLIASAGLHRRGQRPVPIELTTD
ncbi:Mov34/MPN/PAD-1 family protein [Cupriavidus sp. MP-37]|uniref:Mov34/MPN/PAD-1 family protein n=1 Tax=Cupriavidus sp. MP-37 TaxID=2884455 RepID=UPI001D0B0ABD|nr:Mov34/MPN/PAD-1 family protein [Cupriavidus sp. MP-37]UDM50911.1 Mov34/MPN/PAD-1 family protein [Cupriavidus sp. MP-37]